MSARLAFVYSESAAGPDGVGKTLEIIEVEAVERLDGVVEGVQRVDEIVTR